MKVGGGGGANSDIIFPVYFTNNAARSYNLEIWPKPAKPTSVKHSGVFILFFKYAMSEILHHQALTEASNMNRFYSNPDACKLSPFSQCQSHILRQKFNVELSWDTVKLIWLHWWMSSLAWWYCILRWPSWVILATLHIHKMTSLRTSISWATVVLLATQQYWV